MSGSRGKEGAKKGPPTWGEAHQGWNQRSRALLLARFRALGRSGLVRGHGCVWRASLRRAERMPERRWEADLVVVGVLAACSGRLSAANGSQRAGRGYGGYRLATASCRMVSTAASITGSGEESIGGWASSSPVGFATW